MRNVLVLNFLLIALFACTGNKEVKTYNQGINIVPQPQELTVNKGTFVLNKQTEISSFDANIAAFFTNKIQQSTGFSLANVATTGSKNCIKIEQDSQLEINDEGYQLTVNENGVNIKAKTAQGAFYAMQTLMQLLPAEIESSVIVNAVDWTIPFVSIKDQPRFSYRGQHLDVCRHFLPVAFIKKQLDIMSLYKINKLHWHLTDDQGWRIESKKYPKLNEISSTRTEGEGTQHSGYYTHEEIKDVVAYAKARFIDVIPEIELPGHAVAVLTAYPELSCSGGPFQVRNIWGVSSDVFCAGNEATFQFINDIFDEVVPLFESQYVHVGGDECPKTKWKTCPKCQKRIKENKLKDEHELQSYFVQRAEKMLLAKGKKMIGWDEILEGGLAPSATVMSWRGEQGGITAANEGHDVIMTPEAYCYLNWYEGDHKILPIAFGYNISLEKIYNYNPIPAAIAPDKKHHILGTQANMWTEYTYTTDAVEYQLFPRALATAETCWSAQETKDYKGFEKRLDNQMVRLDMHHINYFIPLAEQVNGSSNKVAFVDSTVLEFKTVRPVKIVYTLDGSEPKQSSNIYSTPLRFTASTQLKVRSILASGKMSTVRTITVEKQNYQAAVQKPEKIELIAKVFVKGTDQPSSTLSLNNLAEIPYVKGYEDPKPTDYFDVIVNGYINIPADGVYYFSTDCDEFWINDTELISNKGEVKRHSRTDQSIALAAGYHPIKIVRVGEILGGWPSVWNEVSVQMRPEQQEKFVKLTTEHFK